MPMRSEKLAGNCFGDHVFITIGGHFSTPARICAMGEIGAQSIMFSIDCPFESSPNGCVWWDEYVFTSINIGRNNALRVLPRLMGAPHNLAAMPPAECQSGGLGGIKVTYGMYYDDWNRRLVKH